jgi:hypothetical protein
MKIAEITMEVVLGALMTLAAPGVGTAFLTLMVTMMEVLQTEGVFNLTSKLGDALHSQLGGELMMAALECIVTMGGGYALDEMAASYMKDSVEAAVNTSIQAAKVMLDEAAEAAVSAAAGQASERAIQDTTSLLYDVAERSAERAATNAARQVMKQPFAALIEMMVKGTFSETMQKVMEKAAQEAVEVAIEEASIIAKFAALGIDSTDDIVDGIAVKAADQAVANNTGKKLAQIAEEANAAESPLKTAASRGLWTLTFALANNNFVVDSLKKMGLKDEGALAFFQILQMLIQMFAFIKGSGMLAGSEIDGITTKIPKMAASLTLIPQVGETVASFQNYETLEEQAKAVTKINMDGSVADLLHSFLQELQKDQVLDRELLTKGQVEWAQSVNAMAGHMYDGDQAAIQALVSAV